MQWGLALAALVAVQYGRKLCLKRQILNEPWTFPGACSVVPSVVRTVKNEIRLELNQAFARRVATSAVGTGKIWTTICVSMAYSHTSSAL